MYREFMRDRMYNRLPVVVLRGRYSVTGDLLRVELQGQPAGEYPFRPRQRRAAHQEPQRGGEALQAARDVAAQGVLSLLSFLRSSLRATGDSAPTSED